MTPVPATMTATAQVILSENHIAMSSEYTEPPEIIK